MVSIAEKDLESLYQQGVRGSAAGFALVGRQIASRLRKTEPELAGRLNELLADSGIRSVSRSAPVDDETRRSLLREEARMVFESDPLWDESINELLGGVILEREHINELLEAGLEPARSLIFTGPPGVGKTLAANWLASKLDLPLYTLDLASVMSSLLGKTGSNIKAVIEHAKSAPCVLLLDEFDAIAKRRDDDKDVGELKRLVNVLLQAIDEWPATSVLVAATNHPDMLDPAVWRRFEVTVAFDVAPQQIVKRLLVDASIDPIVAERLSAVLAGQTYAEIQRIITSARKKAVLGKINLNVTIIDTATASTGTMDELHSRDMQILSLSLRGLSQRKIAAQLKLSHPTVGKILKSLKESIHD